MYFLISLLFILNFGTVSNANELILVCKMNYGISGENDETDIEFKNLSIIDEDLVVFLNVEKKWLSVESERDFKESGGKISKSNFLETAFKTFIAS
mgnify:CR=1 FL=1